MACARVVDIFSKTGSHFLTHADWGCSAGVNKAWLTVDVETEQEARAIVPPPFRSQAKIIRLNKFRQEQINDILCDHSPGEADLVGTGRKPECLSLHTRGSGAEGVLTAKVTG